MIRRLLAPLALLCALVLISSTALAFDPGVEAENFSKTGERDRYIVGTPEFQARLNQQAIDDPQRSLAIQAEELPMGMDGRLFEANVCANRQRECAGDVRFYEWEDVGFGKTEEVLFGARNGATISGKVWATKRGPDQRPAVVITTGSVQAPETLYWGFAATLAKHGYVVLTYDVQGQGQSDTYGAGADQQEGVPSQAGQPFYDGTEDALDFLLSTATDPYDPRPSCGNANGDTGTDHSDKHQLRVDAGLNAAYNPYWRQLDPERIGIAGHSLGAGAVSYIGQIDPRVDAIVAWDNLSAPGEGMFGHPDCPSGSSPRPDDPPITKPAIGMSNDYGLVPTPNTSDPGAEDANGGFEAYKAAGVDSMQINRRGGTHFEYSFIPGVTVPPLGLATLRGPDMAIWYTTAWFDRYVKCQGDTACATEAERRLLTDRWRNDAREGQVDPNGDPNLFSFYLRSRYDISGVGGGRATCDDMRTGCASMGPDGLPAGYDHVVDAHTAPTGGGGGGGGTGGEPCTLAQVGTAADDRVTTLPPSDAGDAIRGRGGNDRLHGGPGDDCLYGGAGKDRLSGDDGADRLRGGSGKDRLIGGAGEDRVAAGGGSDRVKLLDGERDRVSCGKGSRDRAVVDRGDRVSRDCEVVKVRKAG